ncbi:type I restriction endonuclease subunit R [Bacillus sp. NPDC057893]|uniref:type I restriction endonuclease subunit R n=1 Tax=Bacillus sp. NPDC057893 TaxID=3346273 RepID=UPI00367194E2
MGKEWKFVEEPFLQQLSQAGWNVVIHEEGIPQDPKISYRSSFREWILKSIFKEYIQKINVMEDGAEWLTDSQLEELYQEVQTFTDNTLFEGNEQFYTKLRENTTVDVNHATGEKHPVVKLIDFKNPKANHFVAINQFRIDTPGLANEFIIPDIVLFVNGLPFVVVECKYRHYTTSDPMQEAIRQLLRYSNCRGDTEGIVEREGEERLFLYNQLMIATTGDEARVGTISSSYEYFSEWKDIYQEANRIYKPPLGKERSQEILIQGMLVPKTFLDIVESFLLYMQVSERKRIKVVARYQQYRAANKAVQRLLKEEKPFDRSGVIWHTQGSGKSLTMVFIIRKIRRMKELKKYKIIIINDRIDLEEQLGATAGLAGEPVMFVESVNQVKDVLSTSISNINMVMVQKFQNKEKKQEQAHARLMKEFEEFPIVNDSEHVLILIDEAHRSHNRELGFNIFSAFPNASKIAFTGTPLISKRHKKRTHEIFGTYIDTYKIRDAVNDEATVALKYEGKAVYTKVDNEEDLEHDFLDLFGHRTQKELDLIRQKYGTLGDILEAEKRIEKIAADIVDHYLAKIYPNGFKAQVVANSKLAAYRYEKYINQELEKRVQTETDEQKKKEIAFLQTALIVSMNDTNEIPEIKTAMKKSRKNKAVDFFKKSFDTNEPRTGIAFIVVCDMLLTGFDAPIEQVMYIDKKMKEHNLLQAIARANRKTEGKECGYIVDYIGVSNHLLGALKMYEGEEVDDTIRAMTDINEEIPILVDRYERLIHFFKDLGVKEIREYAERRARNAAEELKILDQCIAVLGDDRNRVYFNQQLKLFLESMNILMPNETANQYRPMMEAFVHILAQVRDVYKDDTINLMGVGYKIKKLINEHMNVEKFFTHIQEIDILSDIFEEKVKKNKRSARSKASEMEHAIRKVININIQKDPAFYISLSRKLEAIIAGYRHDVEAMFEELSKLYQTMKQGRSQRDNPFNKEIGLIFYDYLATKLTTPEYHQGKLVKLVLEIMNISQTRVKMVDFWKRENSIKEYRSALEDRFFEAGIEEFYDYELVKGLAGDIAELAKIHHQELIH